MRTTRPRPARTGKHGKTPRISRICPEKFRHLRSFSGFTIVSAAQLFHVSERTLRNWEKGAVRIPYSAFKLLRVLHGGELPDPAWDGWSFSRGKLWSPEGYGFKPSDSAWWSLLVERARLGSEVLRKQHLAKARAAHPDAHSRPDHRPGASAPPVGPGVPAPSGAGALASGLVSFTTSDTDLRETQQRRGLWPLASGSEWGHYGAILCEVTYAQPRQIQSPASARSAPASNGHGGNLGHQPERVHGAGPAQLDAVPDQATPSVSGGPEQGSRWPSGPDFSRQPAPICSAVAQNRTERPLPLRQRQEMEVLPRRSDVAVDLASEVRP